MTPHRAPRLSPGTNGSENGFGMLMLIFVILVGAALSAGTIALLGNSQVAQIMPEQESKAYFMAKSGLEYARKALEEGGDTGLVGLNGETRSLPSGSFTIAVSPTTAGAGSYTVSSTGVLSTYPIVKGQHTLVAMLTAPAGPGTDSEPASPLARAVIDAPNTDVDISNSATIEGDVHGKSVRISNNPTLEGNVYSESTVALSNQAKVQGDVCANGNVSLANSAEIEGDLNTFGDVSLTNSARIGGSLYTKGGVTMYNTSSIGGDIHASGSNGTVHLNGSNIVIEGSIHASGSITLEGNVTVKGSVYSLGGITIKTWGRVEVQGGVFPNSATPPTPPLSCYILPAPTEASFTPYSSGTSYHDKNLTLPPGEYGSVSTWGNGSMRLTAGKISETKKASYYFSSFSCSNSTTMYLDMSDENEDLVIFVGGNFTLSNSCHVEVCTTSCENPPTHYLDPFDGTAEHTEIGKELAARIYLETHSAFSASNTTNWLGTILARNNIHFANTVKGMGTYHSIYGTVTAPNGINLTYVPPSAWPVHDWPAE